jgi:hypothetical protein
MLLMSSAIGILHFISWHVFVLFLPRFSSISWIDRWLTCFVPCSFLTQVPVLSPLFTYASLLNLNSCKLNLHSPTHSSSVSFSLLSSFYLDLPEPIVMSSISHLLHVSCISWTCHLSPYLYYYNCPLQTTYSTTINIYVQLGLIQSTIFRPIIHTRTSQQHH